ncbi:MAG: hypothetical protein HYY51_01945 [Candidatus Magasanikbacteria bacterium]|nr:hypothetical protein [Candidatus Magasanikbacteria bacterium]
MKADKKGVMSPFVDEGRIETWLAQENPSDGLALKLARIISRWHMEEGRPLEVVLQAMRDYGAKRLSWDSLKLRESLELLANTGTLRLSVAQIEALVRNAARLQSKHLTQRYSSEPRRPRC